MKSKSRAIILSAAVLTSLVCVGAALASPGRQPAEVSDPSAAQHTDTAPDVSEPTVPSGAKYTVTVYQGKLAVYLSEHMDTPQYVTDVEVATLPAADREALASGIPIDSELALTSLLEDYSS